MFWAGYNLLFHTVFLCMLPRFLWRMRRRGGYRRDFSQRLSRYSDDVRARLSEDRNLWLHAVSVGECQVGLAFIRAWREKHPDDRFVVTVNTSTAHAMAREQLHDRDILLYPPVDSPWVIRRALDAIRPRALILVETEVWPNLLHGLARRQVPVVLLNGRMSDRSYGRLRLVRGLTRRIYSMVTLFCTQSREDADRLTDLGAPADRVQVLHSAKYDVSERDPAEEATRRQELLDSGFLHGSEPVLLGSSTWPGEEAILADVVLALRQEIPDLKLILVPRHAERRADVEQTLQEHALTWWRRSEWQTVHGPPPDVLLVDTTGELRHFYATANMVFVGKSLYRLEGQNPLEAAAAGCAVVTGPGMANFRRIMADLEEADAVCRVRDAAELLDQVHTWLRHPEPTRAMGKRAESLVASRRGALERSVALIDALLDSAGRSFQADA